MCMQGNEGMLKFIILCTDSPHNDEPTTCMFRKLEKHTLHARPHLSLMVHISFFPEEKLYNLVMTFPACDIADYPIGTSSKGFIIEEL